MHRRQIQAHRAGFAEQRCRVNIVRARLPIRRVDPIFRALALQIEIEPLELELLARIVERELELLPEPVGFDRDAPAGIDPPPYRLVFPVLALAELVDHREVVRRVELAVADAPRKLELVIANVFALMRRRRQVDKQRITPGHHAFAQHVNDQTVRHGVQFVDNRGARLHALGIFRFAAYRGQQAPRRRVYHLFAAQVAHAPELVYVDPAIFGHVYGVIEYERRLLLHVGGTVDLLVGLAVGDKQRRRQRRGESALAVLLRDVDKYRVVPPPPILIKPPEKPADQKRLIVHKAYRLSHETIAARQFQMPLEKRAPFLRPLRVKRAPRRNRAPRVISGELAAEVEAVKA